MGQGTMTPTGKRMLERRKDHDGFYTDQVGDDDIRAIEVEAAAMERERLRRKTVETDNDQATWCEDPSGEAATGLLCHRCKGILRFPRGHIDAAIALALAHERAEAEPTR